MFRLKRLLFISFSITFILKCKSTNYCSADICNNSKQHTLCKHQSPDPARHCRDFEKTIKTARDKKAILDKINSRRNRIAVGDIRSLPPADSMLKLGWNVDLEISAQRWANQCVKHSVPDIKDACRDLGRLYVGQNIATIHGDSPGVTPLALVDVWYMELLHINASILSRFRPSVETGHPHYDYFTQLVWAESNQVGCGGVKFKERYEDESGFRNRTIYRLVCNFAPGGNRMNGSVYTHGLPCSRCPSGSVCDFVHQGLCGPKPTTETFVVNQRDIIETTEIIDSEAKLSLNNYTTSDILSNYSKTTSAPDIIEVTEVNNISKTSGLKLEEETYTPFDYFSHLHEYTRQTISETSVKHKTCKDALAVDDFIDILKKKLSNDPMFKELLLSTKSSVYSGHLDTTFSDASVAAFVSRIYSKKSLITTTKTSESDYVNSTLLVDLVEAVIFRSGDKIPAIEIDQNTQSISDVSPVKIQAELAEVQRNQDFTGHYFFPEDDEEVVRETTESYYDTSDLPISDVVLEIEQFRRTTTVKSFLDEILESDLATESTTSLNLLSPDDLTIYKNGYNIMKKFLENITEKGYTNTTLEMSNVNGTSHRNKFLRNQLTRMKRRNNDYYKEICCNNNGYICKNVFTEKSFLPNYQMGSESFVIKYSHLLRRIAADLRNLKLSERFNCSQNCSVKCIFYNNLLIFSIVFTRFKFK